ncbi:hypothetical protein KMW28_13255 [Flammeovirga yaeyamensis]|uniref:PEGA domain-containing protein n=1 Tax=Flammeovirga yaeyamensis TaxID=367791 RepID=A0AAX1MZF0_9BACT|nr:hypothetical protein [Flammeovirga yaeyamensis]MBB3700859.1 hypothetical protein [Flammeovirga yaeyamensis]NMF37967.1 hypothetical protein [Flammeovirga yaeyamensis]QWG00619.1 hypothetical protein KMW28_13255 [Flammeovirga yaeyamensis]
MRNFKLLFWLIGAFFLGLTSCNLNENDEEPMYEVSFTVLDEGNALEGATIIVNGDTVGTTDANGMLKESFLAGVFPYSVVAEGYEDYTNKSFIITDKAVEVSVDLVWIPVTSVVSFSVMNGEVNVEGATLTLSEGTVLTTDEEGSAALELLPGSYTFSIENYGYQTQVDVPFTVEREDVIIETEFELVSENILIFAERGTGNLYSVLPTSLTDSTKIGTVIDEEGNPLKGIRGFVVDDVDNKIAYASLVKSEGAGVYKIDLNTLVATLIYENPDTGTTWDAMSSLIIKDGNLFGVAWINGHGHSYVKLSKDGEFISYSDITANNYYGGFLPMDNGNYYLGNEGSLDLYNDLMESQSSLTLSGTDLNLSVDDFRVMSIAKLNDVVYAIGLDDLTDIMHLTSIDLETGVVTEIKDFPTTADDKQNYVHALTTVPFYSVY